MVFRSAKQRRAFFATGNFKRAPMTPDGVAGSTAFSYRDGRKLGKFTSLEEVFRKFPSERKAFKRVMEFRKKTGKQVDNIEQIKEFKRQQKNNPDGRWDRK